MKLLVYFISASTNREDLKENNAEQKPIAQSVLINLTSLHSSEKISNHIESW